jgi:hypothetical protein
MGIPVQTAGDLGQSRQHAKNKQRSRQGEQQRGRRPEECGKGWHKV